MIKIYSLIEKGFVIKNTLAPYESPMSNMVRKVCAELHCKVFQM